MILEVFSNLNDSMSQPRTVQGFGQSKLEHLSVEPVSAITEKPGWIQEPVKLGEALPLVKFNRSCIHLLKPQSLVRSLLSSV